MHELSLCMGILRILEHEATVQNFGRVRAVRLSVGALAAVDLGALRSSFEIATRGTIADGAGLAIGVVPASGSCKHCGGTFEVTEYVADCPDCPGWPLSVAGGLDLVVKDLEVD